MMRIYVRNEDYPVVAGIVERMGFEPRCELFKVEGEWVLSLNLRNKLGDGDDKLVRELRKYVRVRVINRSEDEQMFKTAKMAVLNKSNTM